MIVVVVLLIPEVYYHVSTHGVCIPKVIKEIEAVVMEAIFIELNSTCLYSMLVWLQQG